MYSFILCYVVASHECLGRTVAVGTWGFGCDSTRETL